MSELLATGYCDFCGMLWSPGHECAIAKVILDLTVVDHATGEVVVEAGVPLNVHVREMAMRIEWMLDSSDCPDDAREVYMRALEQIAELEVIE